MDDDKPGKALLDKSTVFLVAFFLQYVVILVPDGPLGWGRVMLLVVLFYVVMVTGATSD